MYITKRVDVRLNQEQKRIAIEQFDLLFDLWNLYIDDSKQRISEGMLIHRPFNFDTEIYPVIKRDDPRFKNLGSYARQNMLRVDCYPAQRKMLKRCKDVHYRSKKEMPVCSFRFRRSGVRFVGDMSHIWITKLHSIRLCETGYITKYDMDHVTGGSLVWDRYRDQWYIILHIEVPSTYFIDTKGQSPITTPGIGIDVGIRHYITIARADGHTFFTEFWGKNIANPVFSEHVQDLEKKAARLAQVISRKIRVNKAIYGYKVNDKVDPEDYDAIYHSSRIDKLRKRRWRILKKIADFKRHVICVLCCEILRGWNPQFVAIETLDVKSMLNRKYGHEKHFRSMVFQSEFGYLMRRIKEVCKNYFIPCYEIEPTFPSSQICSECGYTLQYHERIGPKTEIFSCPMCKHRQQRDLNAATVILQEGIRKHKEVSNIEFYEHPGKYINKFYREDID